MTKLSILIVNYKGWSALEECLNSLERFNSQKFLLEIIVVDNCSNDGMLETFITKYSTFTFILNSGNNGFANGCNLASLHATADYFLFLNPDTRVDTKDLEVYFQSQLDYPEIALMSCLQIDEKSKYYNQNNLLPTVITFFGLPRAFYKKIFKNKIQKKFNNNDIDAFFYPEWVTGAVIMVSRRWFVEIGGWNEDYWMYMEDVDFCKKINDANGKIAVLKRATIFHQHGGASRINITTKALTKTEVLISKHVYISNNFSKTTSFFLHLRLILGIVLEKSVIAVLPSFFNKKLKVNRLILKNYINYLVGALKHSTFISPRSINFIKAIKE